MDEFTPKTFAVGEILTAQDVNEHLVNRVRRYILTGPQVAESAFGPFAVAVAIVDEDVAGNKTVSLRLGLTNHGGLDSGALNIVAGTLAPEIIPNDIQPMDVVAITSLIGAYITTDGSIRLRYASSSVGTAANIRMGASYPVLAD